MKVTIPMYFPEGFDWHTLENISEQDSDPPGDDDGGCSVDGDSKGTGGKEEAVVEQK